MGLFAIAATQAAFAQNASGDVAAVQVPNNLMTV